jgi:isocitrate/isopropylmalate dehydrogenase
MQAKIGTLPGDGIGPEVVAEGVRVLRRIGERYGHTFEFEEALIGGCAIDAVGNPIRRPRSDRSRDCSSYGSTLTCTLTCARSKPTRRWQIMPHCGLTCWPGWISCSCAN